MVQGELIEILRNRSGFRTLTITISELDVDGMIVLENDKKALENVISQPLLLQRNFYDPFTERELRGGKPCRGDG